MKIPPGYYHTLDQLLFELNKKEEAFTLTVNEKLQMIEVSVQPDVIYLQFSPILALQLGFDPDRNIIKQAKSLKFPALDIGYPQQIFLYTDIIDYQMVGDLKAPLLRIASIPEVRYGRMKTITLNPVHYLPLSKYNFNSIELHLKDHTGKDISFAFGTCTVKLHFQRHGMQKRSM